jgi:hypothetical protein
MAAGWLTSKKLRTDPARCKRTLSQFLENPSNPEECNSAENSQVSENRGHYKWWPSCEQGKKLFANIPRALGKVPQGGFDRQ